MPRASRRKTIPVSRLETRQYMEKARQFLWAAEDTMKEGLHTAAAGNAIHAGISAADALSGAVLEWRWAGEHDQAPAFLESIGNAGKDAAKRLRRLLSYKTKAEYDSAPISKKEAETALRAAQSLVQLAETHVEG